MPVIYRCGSCNHVLYEFLRVGQDSYGLPTPSELIAKLGSNCPHCGKKLKTPALESIKISPHRPRRTSPSEASRRRSGEGAV